VRKSDKFKKNFVFSVLLILSLVFLVSIGEAAKFKLEVKVSKANVRSKPTLQGEVIAQVSRGTKLDSDAQIGNWFSIRIAPQKGKKKVIGYIHQSTVNVLVDLSDVSAEARARREEIGVEERGITGKGVKLGLNLHTLGGGDVQSTDSKMGFAAGGFLTYRINKLISVQPEVLITQKKANSEKDLEGGTWKYKLDLWYLEIPVLVKVAIPVESSLNPSVFAGPVVALKLSGKGKSEFTEGVVDRVVGGLESYDFGVIFGAGVEFTLGFFKKGKFTADVRYNLGLMKINTEKDIKTRAFTFMLGYIF
jgi:hypothetical protein